MEDHPATIEGMADEAEQTLRALVEAKGEGWSLEIDAQAGGGCLVEIRKDNRPDRNWWRGGRLEAINAALDELRQSPL